MYLKAFGHLILISVIALLDVAFVSQLPFGLFRLHLLVIALVFVFLLGNIRLAAWWALAGGFIFELFSLNAFGWQMAASLVALSVIAVLFQKVMTNRSLYSISVVTLAAVLSHDIILLIRDYTTDDRTILSWSSSLAGEGIGLAYNIAAALLVFYLSNALTRQLHPGFLSHKR